MGRASLNRDEKLDKAQGCALAMTGVGQGGCREMQRRGLEDGSREQLHMISHSRSDPAGGHPMQPSGSR